MWRNQKSFKKKPSYGVLGVSCLKIPDFPTSILASCLRSVIAPKRVDWFLCSWWYSLAFLMLFMIHVKKSKIDEEKTKLWGKRELRFCVPPQKVSFPFQFWPLFFEVSCLRGLIAPKQIDRFLYAWCQSLASSKLYMIHVTDKGGSRRPEKSGKNWIYFHGQGQCRGKSEGHGQGQWFLNCSRSHKKNQVKNNE